MMKHLLLGLLFVSCGLAVITTNPFKDATFFVNPLYVQEMEQAATQSPQNAGLFNSLKQYSTAFWVDTMAMLTPLDTYLNAAKSAQASSGQKTVVTVIVYDLPNRDCNAAASAGELSCADSDCVDGINTYKTQYIDPLVATLKKYPTLTIATIVEPDSLPNIATNLATAKCAQAEKAYRAGISYAVQSLATVNNVAIYIDAAHGGWLGWPNNLKSISTIFKSVLDNAGGQNLIRGFATNVANYQPLGSMSNSADPCRFTGQANNAIDETHYINLLDAALTDAGITGKGYVTDTGRNGGAQTRSTCANWCNIKGAGVGQRPSTDTGLTGLGKIDAFVWVKPPGESDGTSDSSAPRYDPNCGSGDALGGAPQAGKLFLGHLSVLAQNAQPALTTVNSPSSANSPGNSGTPATSAGDSGSGCIAVLAKCKAVCGNDLVKACDCKNGVLDRMECADPVKSASSLITFSVLLCIVMLF